MRITHIPFGIPNYSPQYASLVIAEGLILKGPKLKKYVSTFALEGWSFSSEKKEALNLDITGEYPSELLELTMKFPDPSEIMKYVVTAGMK